LIQRITKKWGIKGDWKTRKEEGGKMALEEGTIKIWGSEGG
jgi:hypothetical protein